MSKRPWLVIGVVILVATAGCSGILGGGDDGSAAETTGDDATTTGTTSDDGATSTDGTTTDGGTTTDDGTTTDGSETTTEERGTDTPSPARDALENHESTLESAGSWTAELVQNRTSGGESINVTALLRIDVENDRYLSEVSGTLSGRELEVDRYTYGDRTAERFTIAGQTRTRSDTEPYDDDVQPVDVGNAKGGDGFLQDMARTDLEEDGTVTFQGEEMTRYTASGPAAWDTDLPEGAEELDSFQMRVFVDDDGVARLVEYTVTGTSTDGSDYYQYYRLEISDVGSTTVEQPDWASDARLVVR